MNKPLKLPTDVHSLLRAGILNYPEMRWPVSDEQFFKLTDTYHEIFNTVCLDLEFEFRGIFQADFVFCFYMLQISHAIAVSRYCQQNGIECLVGPMAKSYYDPDWHAMSDMTEGYTGNAGASLVKGFVKDVKFNDHISLFKRIACMGDSVAGIGSFTRLKADYARLHDVRVRNLYIQNLLPADMGQTETVPEFDRAAKAIIDGMATCFKEIFGFGPNYEKQAVECWNKRLSQLNTVSKFVADHIDVKGEVWVTEVARPLHRAVAFAYRLAGGRAVAFQHATEVGGRVETQDYNLEFTSFDSFLCPTQPCAEANEAYYLSSAISKKQPMEFISTETEYYRELHQACSQQKLPEQVKTVMLVGFPMSAIRSVIKMPVNFYYYYVSLELHILRLLKENGYRILYKIHPERMGAIEEIVGPHCDEIVSKPFEETWEMADAFIVTKSASTTFGFSLCTNRRILLFDHERSAWNPEHYELLKRRCQIIPASLDETDCINYDESVLLEALRAEPSQPDYSYLYKYMYPLV